MTDSAGLLPFMKQVEERRRAAIFFVEGYLSIQPSVLSTAIKLVEYGYDVDLFYVRPVLPVPTPTLPPGVRLVEYSPYRPDFVKLIRKSFSRSRAPKRDTAQATASCKPGKTPVRDWVRSLVRNSESFVKNFNEVVGFGLFCRRQARPIDFAIAFDMTGLAAMTIAVPRKVPFIYWSLEITLLSEVRTIQSILLKRLEMRRLEKARAIVVQDRERAHLLAKDSAFDQRRIAIVPNGPPGPRRDDLPRDFFTQRFDILPSATIVLHAGFIHPFMNSREIAAASTSWPENFVLVFHDCVKTSPTDSYRRSVQAAGGNRVLLSLDPVPFDMVDVVYAGAQIGLVSYDRRDANFATALMASGKLAYYLRNGLPVVLVSDRRASFVDRWECCVCVSDISEIGNALAMIAADYARFSREAKQCYDEIFDFGRAFDRLMVLAEVNEAHETASSNSSPASEPL
jgi:hypothetical protein